MAARAVLDSLGERGVGDDCTSHLLQGRPGGQAAGSVAVLQKTTTYGLYCSLLVLEYVRPPASAQMKVRDGVCCPLTCVCERGDVKAD